MVPQFPAMDKLKTLSTIYYKPSLLSVGKDDTENLDNLKFTREAAAPMLNGPLSLDEDDFYPEMVLFTDKLNSNSICGMIISVCFLA